MALFYSFLHNIATMLAVAIVYSFAVRSLKNRKIITEIVSGVAFSIAVLITMQNRFVLTEGVVFDARSVVISICGMFAGPIAVFMTSITALIHRIWHGGGGTFMGICVIISSALIGLLFHYLRKSRPQLTNAVNLYAFGFIVHINMLFWALTLPQAVMLKAYKTITLPVLLILPLGSLCFGKLLSNQEEQIEIANELVEKEKLLRETAEIAKIGAWEFDVNTGQNKWTDEVFRIHDLNPGRGDNVETGLSLYSAESRKKLETAVKEAIEFNTAYGLELEMTTAKGIDKWVRILGTPVLEDNKVIKVHGSFQDITERKRAQKKEMLAMIELAKVKEIDKVKNTFIASMSHELRTPLNSIIGFTGILLMGMTGELNEEQKKQLGMVKGSASHLLALINDVIDVSKVEAGKIELAIEEFELETVINEARDSVANNINEKKLELAIDLPAGLKIKSDRRRVKQIIINLLSNAVKFTEHGEITIEAARENNKVKVKVTDTGIGIRAEDGDKLFKQFSRIIMPGRPLQEGTGLGLYLSQKIAGMLGGEITAQSEIGKGSAFILELPYEIKVEVVYA
jgi:K+-sensing histidine kinase KdpD